MAGRWAVAVAAALAVAAGATGCGGGAGDAEPTLDARVDALHRPDGPRVDAGTPDAPEAATDRLHVASGTGAPLLDQLPEGTGSDLRFQATLGPDRHELANDEGSRTWLCFQPDPPAYTTYNLTSFGETDAGTFYVDVAVAPAVWAEGDLAIDGNDVVVFVGDHGPGKGTIGARATGGTLRLTAAPTTVGEPCAFELTDVPLAVIAL